jgi:hypothetical protein
MKKIGDPSHGICSKFISSPSSWEVFLQLEVEHGLELEAASLVASH